MALKAKNFEKKKEPIFIESQEEVVVAEKVEPRLVRKLDKEGKYMWVDEE